MKKVIVITGASSGFGRLSANALAKAGHTVYASMRDTAGRNAPQAADVKKFAHDNKVDLRPIELDVSSEKSIEAAIRQVCRRTGQARCSHAQCRAHGLRTGGSVHGGATG